MISDSSYHFSPHQTLYFTASRFSIDEEIFLLNDKISTNFSEPNPTSSFLRTNKIIYVIEKI